MVSARKYRPVTFNSVVGQSSLTTTLKNSIASGRLAHAYLFCGPRGVGKTTCARIFAKTINCLQPKPNGDACEQCESCRAFNEQRSYNIHELDAASNNGVDDIRQLIEQVNIPPQIGKYKVFIIDEVHMLSTAAFNAFLKTLEEPPAHAIFILATTEKHKLLPTILSRCQIYDFNRMSIQDIVGHLENVARQENVTFEPEALNVIAQKADGGMRDALSIFDQVASFCQGNITYQQTIADLNVLDYEYHFRLVDDFLEGKVPDIMLTLNDILNKGFDGSHFIGGLNNHLRNLLISHDEATVQLLEVSNDVRQRYVEQARRCQPRFLYAAIRKCTDCDLNYRQSQNKRLLVELTLIEIAQLAQGDSDGQPSGHCPTKILKPLFKVAAEPVSAQPSAPVQAVQAESTSPAPAVPQSTAPTPSSASAKSTSAGRFSILAATHSPQAVAQPAAAEPSIAPSVSAPAHTPSSAPSLTTETLAVEWRAYADTLPHEDIALATRMKNAEPQLADDGTTITLDVDNKNVEEVFQQNAQTILTALRYKFQRTDLQLRISIVERESQQEFHTPTEQFQIMCRENEALQKLFEEFDLALG